MAFQQHPINTRYIVISNVCSPTDRVTTGRSLQAKSMTKVVDLREGWCMLIHTYGIEAGISIARLLSATLLCVCACFVCFLWETIVPVADRKVGAGGAKRKTPNSSLYAGLEKRPGGNPGKRPPAGSAVSGEDSHLGRVQALIHSMHPLSVHPVGCSIQAPSTVGNHGGSPGQSQPKGTQ